MVWGLTSVGVALILVVVRDLFHTLWHPGGFGTLTRLVFKIIWRASSLGPGGGSSMTVAGPLGLLAVLTVWTVLLVWGFALVYLPRMPADFYFGTSLQPQEASDLVASLYLSVVALATLGLGDILPSTPALRFLVPAQALLGFLLLTAGISWILQLYPALIRRRAMSRRLTSMARHDATTVVRTGEASVAVQLLEAVRVDLASAEMDLLQYGESYYFREKQQDLSLAAALPHVAELVAAGERSSAPEVRAVAATLGDGLAELLTLLRRDFLGEVGDEHATLVAFARDHGQPAPL